MWIKTIAHSVSLNPMRRRPACRRRPASRMNLELLEDRRLLAITANTLVDELDGSIADGDFSLRDAITAASSGETINFATTGIIHLTLGQLPQGRFEPQAAGGRFYPALIPEPASSLNAPSHRGEFFVTKRLVDSPPH